MSEKQNYDKILLASGIVLGLGVAAYGTLTFLGLNDKYKFTTQVSEKAIEPPPGIKKAAEVGQELSASHELKPIAQETQKYVGFVAPNLWINGTLTSRSAYPRQHSEQMVPGQRTGK